MIILSHPDVIVGVCQVLQRRACQQIYQVPNGLLGEHSCKLHHVACLSVRPAFFTWCRSIGGRVAALSCFQSPLLTCCLSHDNHFVPSVRCSQLRKQNLLTIMHRGTHNTAHVQGFQDTFLGAGKINCVFLLTDDNNSSNNNINDGQNGAGGIP